MNALVYSRFGEPADVLDVQTSDALPEPGAGEVRLRILRSPVHNHDLATIRGVYGYKPSLPATAGSEVVGIVDAHGAGVSTPAVGTRVCALVPGAWAGYALANAQTVIPVPDAFSDDVAAQLVAMPLSAVVLLQSLNVKEGDWIAQNAAGGAVGKILMKIAQAQGVNVINIVRRDDAAEELRAYGARHVVSSSNDDWMTQVRALAPGGVARIVDSIAGPQTMDLQRLLAPRGELIVFGGLSGQAIKLDPSVMISHEIVVRGYWMTSWMARATYDERVAAIGAVFAGALAGEFPLAVGGVYPLLDFKAALKAAETPGRAGKILFDPAA
jgi:NADPH:quinone reductase-like Zn-dependent oxidoreductase